MPRQIAYLCISGPRSSTYLVAVPVGASSYHFHSRGVASCYQCLFLSKESVYCKGCMFPSRQSLADPGSAKKILASLNDQEDSCPTRWMCTPSLRRSRRATLLHRGSGSRAPTSIHPPLRPLHYCTSGVDHCVVLAIFVSSRQPLKVLSFSKVVACLLISLPLVAPHGGKPTPVTPFWRLGPCGFKSVGLFSSRTPP